ncbi:hypothetical protein [Microvirga alba]|uniref:DUF3551 domain-containing protein n=1 Tax=Microvirga alba TaxID=2791025 RepID=A0A931BSC7_9HYPH|nr:hypothetical protein [Microvirga alba]MBF9234345.1 hypothetical protein [Microvirga alba]
MRRVVVVFLTMLAGAPANAGAEPGSSYRQAQTPEHNLPDCYCRANGRVFAMGERVCLRTPRGARIAQCGMAINVTSWEITEIPCPES